MCQLLGMNSHLPASLTLSQFAILEEPAADEPAMRVDATWATDQQVAAVQGFLR